MDMSADSKDRRTSSTVTGENGMSSGGGAPNSNGIAGLGNIDSTVHHYELPNLAQCIYTSYKVEI
jgi:hypothetical protein